MILVRTIVDLLITADNSFYKPFIKTGTTVLETVMYNHGVPGVKGALNRKLIVYR